MRRFIVAVRAGGFSNADPEVMSQIASATVGWHLLLDTPFARAWIDPGVDGSASRGPGDTSTACRIGLNFQKGSTPFEVTTFDSGIRDCGGWGAYVEISVDRDRNSVLIYRDPTGRQECWRTTRGGIEVIFSDLDDVMQLFVPTGLTLNWDYLRFHLANRWLHNEETGYEEIVELLPGDELMVEPGRAFSRRRWSPLSFVLDPFGSVEAAQTALRASAEAAINAWAERYRAISLDLSGGLDSAIVLGLLRKAYGHSDVVGLNYTIPHAEGDERSFASDAAKLNDVRVFERDLTDATPSQVAPFKHRLMRPSIRTMPLGHDAIGSAFQREFKRDSFFTGTGGDHIFYDHVRPTAAVDHYRHFGLRGLIKQSHYLGQVTNTTMWDGLRAVRYDAFSPHRSPVAALRAKCSAYFPENYFARVEAYRDPHLDRFLNPAVLEVADEMTPSKLTQFVNIIELQKHYWRYGRADASDEVHPLFSQPLIETSLRIPTYMFCINGIQRGLARAAFDDLLPRSIAQRRFKSSNTSHWVQVLSSHLPKYRALLLEGQLAERRILERDRAAAITNPLGLVRSANFSSFLNTISVAQWIEQAS